MSFLNFFYIILFIKLLLSPLFGHEPQGAWLLADSEDGIKTGFGHYKIVDDTLLFSSDNSNWTKINFFCDVSCSKIIYNRDTIVVLTKDGIYYQNKLTENPFVSTIQNLGEIKCSTITEASGIVASRINRGVFWTHNDSGDKNYIYAFDRSGDHLGRFLVKGAKNRDWEDIAIGSDLESGKYYIYIADIGDNRLNCDTKIIYRIKEPEIDFAGLDEKDRMTEISEKIRFRYPENKKYDSETLLFDPLTSDLYVITKRKRDDNCKVDFLFRLSYPQSFTKVNIAEKVADIKIPPGFLIGFGAVGGDISASGREILVKNYTNIYYWKRREKESLQKTFETQPIKLPYASGEVQGEAICWGVDGESYYTTSEEFNNDAYLIYYPIERWKKVSSQLLVKLKEKFGK